MKRVLNSLKMMLTVAGLALLGTQAAALPDLAISSGSSVPTNPDMAITKAFPVMGRPVQVTVNVRNIGDTPVGRCPVTIDDGNGFAVSMFVARIDARSSAKMTIGYLPKTSGNVPLNIRLDPDNAIREINETNNSATVRIPVAEKDVFIMWYGDAPDLKYSNIAQTREFGIAEWKRRGAYAATYAEPIRDSVEQLVPYYSELLDRGFDTLAIDELGAAEANKNQHWVEGFRRTKRSYPSCFIAAWYVGRLDSQMSRLVRERVVDLLVCEAYVTPDKQDWSQKLQFYIDQAKSHGVLDRSIIGLGSDQAYSGGLDAGAHAAFIEKQIAYIRSNAPEMPGIAFFTALTLPGERELIDDLCRKYFFEQAN